MLEPQSRATLTDQLKPPPEYELSRAVGTTFTLELATALAVPLSFASHRVADTTDPIGILDAIRRASDRIDIFAQAGEMSLGAQTDLVAFLEKIVHPVRAKRGLFHPKVWFLEYSSGERRAYRFLCASRNLTPDRSWDVLVRLDGTPAPDGNKQAAASINRPLVALLDHLAAMAVNPMPVRRAQALRAFAQRLRHVEWERPADVKRIEFHAFGVPGQARPEVRGRRALIISPFLSDGGLSQLRQQVRGETHVVSRVESLERLGVASLDDKLRTYVLDDAVTDIDNGGDEVAMVPWDRLSGLHAKVVVTDRADGAHVLLGSANATDAAWRDNVEVMIEFTGSSRRIGVAPTLEALGALKEEVDIEGGQTATAEEEADHRLEVALRRIAAGRITVRVLPGDPYALAVWGDGTVAGGLARAQRDGTTLRWHLLTRADLGASELREGEASASLLLNVELTDITPFLALTAREASGRERKTVVLAELLDDVPSRRDAVIARQLTDRATFVRLLTLMLELSGVTALMPSSNGAFKGFAALGAGGSVEGAGLFEALIRAVGNGQQGLADAKRIIDVVRAQPGRDEILPDGFDELWSRVWETHLSMTGARS